MSEAFRAFCQTYEMEGNIIGFSILVLMCLWDFYKRRKAQALNKAND